MVLPRPLRCHRLTLRGAGSVLATRYTHRILGLRRGLPASLPVSAVSSMLPDDGGLISTQADAQPLGAQTCLLLNRNGYSDALTPEIPVF